MSHTGDTAVHGFRMVGEWSAAESTLTTLTWAQVLWRWYWWYFRTELWRSFEWEKPSPIPGICFLNGRDTFYPCVTTKRISWYHLETISSNPWSLMTVTLRSSKSVFLMSMILKQLFSSYWHRQLPHLPRLKTHGAEPASCCSLFLQQSWGK